MAMSSAEYKVNTAIWRKRNYSYYILHDSSIFIGKITSFYLAMFALIILKEKPRDFFSSENKIHCMLTYDYHSHCKFDLIGFR